jgi:Bacterial regulatory helix-turn-helix protein, lysR family
MATSEPFHSRFSTLGTTTVPSGNRAKAHGELNFYVPIHLCLDAKFVGRQTGEATHCLQPIAGLVLFWASALGISSKQNQVRSTIVKFRHLEYFVAAAEELNFTHAADRLHVSQPPFSKQIHDLEAELGIDLFARQR